MMQSFSIQSSETTYGDCFVRLLLIKLPSNIGFSESVTTCRIFLKSELKNRASIKYVIGQKRMETYFNSIIYQYVINE